MPLTVRKYNAEVRDDATGDMIPAGLLSSDALGAINTAKTEAVDDVESHRSVAVAAIELKGATTLASIPSDYTALQREVTDIGNAIDYQSAIPEQYWIRKGLSSAEGAESDSTIRICTSGYIPGGVRFVSPNTGYSIAVYAWNDNDEYQGVWDGSAWVNTGITWFTEEIALKSLPGDYNIRIAARLVSNGSINVGAAVNIIFSFLTDTTLNMSGIPADAKAAGGKIADLKNALDDVAGKTVSIDFSSTPSRTGYIDGSNVWKLNSNTASFYFAFEAGTYNKLIVTSKTTVTAVVGLLKNGTLTSDASPNFCTGISGRISIPVNTTQEISIPEDCTYITITKNTSSYNLTPASASFLLYKKVPAIDNTLAITGDAADAKATGDAIGAVKSYIVDTATINLSDAITTTGNVRADGTWNTNSANGSYWIPVTNQDSVTIAANSNSSVVCFLKNGHISSGEPVSFCDGTGRTVISGNAVQEFSIPADCAYVYLLKNAGSTDYSPTSVVFNTSKITGSFLENECRRLGLHTIIKDAGALNVVKRARQCTDIKWTPAVDLPRFMLPTLTPPYDSTYSRDMRDNYRGVFKAGIEYTGLPYGRCDNNYIEDDYGYPNTFIGNTINFETFVTAVENSESIISKGSVYSKSTHHTLPYAAICSSLVTYAIDVPYVMTADIPSISGMTLLGNVYNNGAYYNLDNLRIGDILNKEHDHTAIIIDIERDADNHVSFLEIAEATTVGQANPSVEGGQNGGLARRRGFAANEFKEYWQAYKLYRYNNISNVTYTPNKYVQLDGEFKRLEVRDCPCMPYQGNGFVFKVGYIPNTNILINTSGYNYLRVYKDGSEIAGSPFAVTSGDKYVTVGFSSTGDYEAYLCNMENGVNSEVTAKCYWSVIE